jgi:uncharacterized protein
MVDQYAARPRRAMALTKTVIAEAEAAVLCWLATVDPDGAPSVSPKEIFAPLGTNRLIIADVASTGSVDNVRAHPPVCVSFIDVFKQKGFKLRGRAEILTPGDDRFADECSVLRALAGEAFPIRHVISVAVERVERIWAPSYAIFPERTDEERMAPVYARYGVRPVSG